MSSTGLALNAARWSTPASKTMGISVLKMKLLVAGFAAFVAGIGGAMFALSLGSALPSNYSTLGGLVWLAVLVSLGIRSNMAALIAGLSATLLAGIALVYLPKAFGEVTPILFGLGAIQVAKFPNGIMTENARQVRAAWDRMAKVSGRPKRSPGTGATPTNGPHDQHDVLVQAGGAAVAGGDFS
jgi:branched-chain amino acid transport system permease protein